MSAEPDEAFWLHKYKSFRRWHYFFRRRGIEYYLKAKENIVIACTISADEIKRVKTLGFHNSKGMTCQYGLVEKQLLANDLLERKQEILDAKLHLAGGATC